MKATEIQELTNRFIALCQKAEYEKSSDPFRAFWLGFDAAAELAIEAMRQMVKDHSDEIENDFEKKDQREITNVTYRNSAKRQSEELMRYIGGY